MSDNKITITLSDNAMIEIAKLLTTTSPTGMPINPMALLGALGGVPLPPPKSETKKEEKPTIGFKAELKAKRTYSVLYKSNQTYYINFTFNKRRSAMTIISKTSYQAHVKYNGNFYVVSSNGMETLVFPSDAQGNITSWCEVGGGRGMTLDEVLSDFRV